MLNLSTPQNKSFLTLNSKSPKESGFTFKSLNTRVEYKSIIYPNKKTDFYLSVYTPNQNISISSVITVPFNQSFLLNLNELKYSIKQILSITPHLNIIRNMYIADKNNSKIHCKELMHYITLIFKSKLYTKHEAISIVPYDSKEKFSFSFNNYQYYTIHSSCNMDMDWFKYLNSPQGLIRLSNYINNYK